MRKGRFAAVVFALGAGAVIAAAPAVASDDESDSAGATVASSVAEPSEDEGSDSDTSVDTVDTDEVDDADLDDAVEPEEVDDVEEEVEEEADEVEDIAEVEVEEIEVTDDELDEGDDVITLEDAPEVVETTSEVPAAPKAVPGSDPGPGTLLYLNPFGGSMDPHKFLDGMFVDPGTKVVNVPYPNSLFDSVSNDNANIAVANLTEALANNPGTTEVPTKVIGHSAGGQMIYKWVREVGPTSPQDPDTVVFYSVGNPEQKYTGASYRYTAESPPIYPGGGAYGDGWGLPVSGIPWTIHTVANEYDGWADAPADPNNVEVLKTVGGKSVHWSQSMFCWTKSSSGPHSGKAYIKNLDDAYTHQDTGQGANVYYHWIPRDPMPRAKNLGFFSFMRQEVELEARPILNEAYNDRPGNAAALAERTPPAVEPWNFFDWLFSIIFPWAFEAPPTDRGRRV